MFRRPSISIVRWCRVGVLAALMVATLRGGNAQAVRRPDVQEPECVTCSCGPICGDICETGCGATSTTSTSTTTTTFCNDCSSTPGCYCGGSTTTTLCVPDEFFECNTTTTTTTTTSTTTCTTTTTRGPPGPLETNASGFGSAVAIGNTLAVIGNPGFDGGVSTARFVVDETLTSFTYNEIESAFLAQPFGFVGACGAITRPQFGFSVDIWADEYLVVGAPREYGGAVSPYGEVWCFEWRDTGQDWGAFDEPMEKLAPPPADRFAGLRFGHAVALYGDILVVGAPGDDGRNDGGAVVSARGSVFVYRRVTSAGVSTWQLAQKILPSEGSGQNFGHDVDVGADGTIIVGALAPTGQDNGTVSIFRPVAVPNGAADSASTFPRVAALADGGFVVTWQENVDATRVSDIFAQRFEANGAPVGFESSLSGARKDNQRSPSAVATSEGFVAVWTGKGVTGDGALGGISARRFGAAVIPLDAEFQINSNATGHQHQPAVTALGSGRIGLTWAGGGAGDNSGDGVFARAFDGETPVAAQARVNEFTTGGQRQPTITPHGQGFLIVWESDGEDGSEEGVYARALDANATPTGSAFRVNETTSLAQQDPAVAHTTDGGFAIVWESAGQDGNGSGVFARRFGLSGSPAGGEFQVNVTTLGDQSDPSVTRTQTGAFAIVWTSAAQDGDSNGVFLRRFSSKGVGGNEIQVNEVTGGDQQNASIATLAGGDLLVAWQSDHAGGGALMGRRFSETGDPLSGEFRIDNIFATWTLAHQFTDTDVLAGTLGLGATVAIAGEEVVFGAPGDGSVVCGNAFASERIAGEWSTPQNLSVVWAKGPPDPDPFECIGFGGSVAIDENLVLVGAAGSFLDSNSRQGRVYPFRRFALRARAGFLDAGEVDPDLPVGRLLKPGSPTDVYGPKACKPGCYAKKVRIGRAGRVVVSCPCDGDGEIQPDANRRLLCGNGIVNTGAGEQCDDGDLVDGDCCAADCKFESNESFCDDGNECTIESCDGEGRCEATIIDESCTPRCGQPISTGPRPVATDCLFILQAGVGTQTCDEACVCDLNGSGGDPTATDALLCVNALVGAEGLLNCSCP